MTAPTEPSPNLLAEKLDGLSPTPGCYLFLGKNGEVVYVGKAKSLRSRVRSYFQEGGSDSRYFIPLLRRIVIDLETVVTATEKEAAVLENQLIKKHQPRFNVKLRDDKEFLSLRLDPKKEWPFMQAVRRPDPDGARYFGPFHSATSARRTLHLVNKHWKLRTCSDAELASRQRPCLQYQIKRCLAPCVMDVDQDVYGQQVRSVALFLEGRHDELSKELDVSMKQASQRLEFERAAIYRDQPKAEEPARESQRIASVQDVDQDVVGLYREGSVVEVEILQVRHGRVRETLSYSLRGAELPDEEVLSGFLTEYYDAIADGREIPDEVLLPLLPDGAAGVAEWLSDRRSDLGSKGKVSLLAPQRGPRRELLDLANEYAAHALPEKQRSKDDLESRLEELQERLRLPTLPRRIECCDISHLGGGDTVGSIVSLADGLPEKKRYRTFHVKTVSDGDDYGAMYEVLARRFRRGRDAKETEAAEAQAREGTWELPDLFVVDGGRGQLGVALSAARDLGLHELPIVGLAKERENMAGEKLVDRVYLPGQKNGIPLRPGSSALFFLARARDEAPRFANHARKKLGKTRSFHSELDDIAGISKAVQKTLLTTLGSVAAIKRASDEELLGVQGITKRHVVALRKVFAGPEPAQAPLLSPEPPSAQASPEERPNDAPPAQNVS